MRSGKIWISMTMLLVLLLAATVPALAAAYPAEVLGDGLTVYARAGSKPIGWLSSGSKVTVHSSAKGWAKITYGGQTAYIASSELSYPTARIGFAARDTLIYSQPNEFSQSLAVQRGFPVYVIGQVGQFFAVENASGSRGYAVKGDLTPNVPTGSNPFQINPGWERRSCMLLLPSKMNLYAAPKENAETMTLPSAAPCYVLGRSGDYYIVSNAKRSAVAYIRPTDLLRAWTL